MNLKTLPLSLPRWNSLRMEQAAWKRLLPWLLMAAAFVALMALVQFATPDLPDNDGYYHIKLAYLMRTEGLKPAFPWLPLSILNPREFYDHHFLFHVALIPFTFGDLRDGAKWAAVVFAALAFLSTWNLLRNQRAAYPALWALGLVAVSEAFLYRMSITRAQSLSLVVLMLGLDWLLRRKYNRLAALAFVYVWLYNAFPLLPVVAGFFTVSAWLLERRLDLRPLAYVSLGTALGLVINPYFPHNIVFAYLHMLPKLTETTAVSVGSEWYPYSTAQLLGNSPLALVAFVSGALALGLSGRRMDTRTLTSFLLAGLFGLMLFQSRRFIEYFPPFALVFAAFAWTPVIEDARTGARRMLARTLPALALATILLAGAWWSLQGAQASLLRSKPYNTYAGASAWLAGNTPAGARVFQTDWDDFPRLFYYNTHNTYLIGLDPTYMLLFNADLYHRWVAVTRGVVENPSAVIAGEFGSRFVVTDLRHNGFLKQAAADPRMTEVYRDDNAVVFQVADPRSPQP
jgi:hypothetical protein